MNTEIPELIGINPEGRFVTNNDNSRAQLQKTNKDQSFNKTHKDPLTSRFVNHDYKNGLSTHWMTITAFNRILGQKTQNQTYQDHLQGSDEQFFACWTADQRRP